MEREPTHEDMGQYMHRRFPQWYDADGTRNAAGDAHMEKVKAEALDLLGGPPAKRSVA